MQVTNIETRNAMKSRLYQSPIEFGHVRASPYEKYSVVQQNLTVSYSFGHVSP
jgi:hypothetical protein